MEKELKIQSDFFKEYLRTKHLKTLETFQTNVILASRLLDNLTSFPDRTETESNEFLISINNPQVNEPLKSGFKKWIIVAGFDELFKWIKELLIDYLSIKEGLNKKQLPNTIDDFKKNKDELYDLHIPVLIERCKAYINEKNFLDNYHSYNKARNCLHHGNETLTKKFCTSGKDILEITGRRLILISDNGKESKEIGPDGKCLENGAIKISASDFCIEKRINEKIDFSFKEFYWLKDLGIFLYAQLSTDLFGVDDRPLINFILQYTIHKVENKD